MSAATPDGAIDIPAPLDTITDHNDEFARSLRIMKQSPRTAPAATQAGRTGRPPKYVLTDEIRAALVERYDGRKATLEALGDEFGIPFYKFGEWAREIGLQNQLQPLRAHKAPQTRYEKTSSPSPPPVEDHVEESPAEVQPYLLVAAAPDPAISSPEPLLSGLLERQPLQQGRWTPSLRLRWLRAFTVTLDLLIDVVPEEVRS